MKSLILVIVVITLSGCTSHRLKPVTKTTDFGYTAEQTYALFDMPLSSKKNMFCAIGQTPFRVSGKIVRGFDCPNNSFEVYNKKFSHYFSFDHTENTDKPHKHKVFLMPVEPGEYFLSNTFEAVGRKLSYTVSTSPQVAFTIEPGKVNYVHLNNNKMMAEILPALVKALKSNDKNIDYSEAISDAILKRYEDRTKNRQARFEVTQKAIIDFGATDIAKNLIMAPDRLLKINCSIGSSGFWLGKSKTFDCLYSFDGDS